MGISSCLLQPCLRSCHPSSCNPSDTLQGPPLGRSQCLQWVEVDGQWGWLNYKCRPDRWSTLLHLIIAAIKERLEVFVSLLIKKYNCSPSTFTYRDSSIIDDFYWIWPIVHKIHIVWLWRAAVFFKIRQILPVFPMLSHLESLFLHLRLWHRCPHNTAQPETRTEGKPYFY